MSPMFQHRLRPDDADVPQIISKLQRIIETCVLPDGRDVDDRLDKLRRFIAVRRGIAAVN